jgi:ribosomal protein L40E
MKGLNVIRRRRADRPADEADAAQAATEAPTTAQPAAGAGPAAMSGVVGGAGTPAAAGTPDGARAPGTADAPAAAGTAAAAGTPDAAGTAAAAGTPDAAGSPGAAASAGSGEAEPGTVVPAGQEAVPDAPSFRQRGRLRRRLRYLRRVRELGFRDLGGLVFDQHRFSSVNEELVRGKLAALNAVDAELRTLEHALGERRPITELREPGISVCPRCGALHGSEARFCPSCGVAFHGPLVIGEVGESFTFAPVTPAPAAPAPAPRPAPPTDPPTQIMRPVDGDGVDRPHGTGERFAQPSGERSEP